MFGKIKKIFFTSVFGILYLSFIAQLVYVLTNTGFNCDEKIVGLALLSIEWLVLIAARYLSKRSASNNNASFSGNNYRRR